MPVTQPIRALIRLVSCVTTTSVFVFALSWGAAAEITEIIDSTGAGIGMGFGGPHGAAADSSGNAYVAGGDTDNVFKITPGGTMTEIIDGAGDGLGNPLNHPTGVAVHPTSGNVYVTGSWSNNVFKIDAPGTCSTGGTPCTITEIIDFDSDGTNHLATPLRVAVDSSENVYTTGLDSDNAFRIATPSTCSTGGTPCTITEIIEWSGDTSGNFLENPIGVAVDSSGNVYVADTTHHNAFKIATPSTCSTGGTPCTITEIIDGTGDGAGNTLNTAYGVAADVIGNVYVTGHQSDNAFKIDLPGTCSTGGTPCTITEIIDSDGDGGGSTLDGSLHITVDDNDNVYVIGIYSNNIFKIDPGGAITKIIDETGDGAGNTLEGPYDVAVDSSGNVYVVGDTSDNAFEITPEPVYSAVPSAPIIFNTTSTISAGNTYEFTLQGTPSISLDKDPIAGSVQASSATVTVSIGPNVAGFSDFSVTSGTGQFNSYLWDAVSIPSSTVTVLSGTGSVDWATGAIDFQGNVHVEAVGFVSINAHAFGSATMVVPSSQAQIETTSQAIELADPYLVVPSTGTLALWAIACGLLLAGTVVLAMRSRESPRA